MSPLQPARSRTIVLVAAIVLADQLTKAGAAAWAPHPLVDPTTNPEAALGLVDAPWLVLCLGAVLAVALVVGARRHWSLFAEPWWALPAFVAGAASNLLDRIRLGAVRDFAVTPWFVFNLADVAILAALVGWYVAAARRSLRRRRARGPLRSSTPEGR